MKLTIKICCLFINSKINLLLSNVTIIAAIIRYILFFLILAILFFLLIPFVTITFPFLKARVFFRFPYIMDKKYKVLIVDDNQELARSIGIYLMQQGYELGLSANNYESVKAILAYSFPDLVLIERFINGNETESIKIAAFIDLNYHLPIVFFTQNEILQCHLLPSSNHLFIPHPAINSHYLAHVMVGIDNLLCPDIIHKSISHFIELNVAIVPLLKNGEPKSLKKEDVHYIKREVNLFKIPLMRANNLGSRNTCLLWEENNHDFCLLESTSLLKLALRHENAHLMRISKSEMIMVDMILSFVLHHTINVDNNIVEIGKSYKKIVDAYLLSIPRLN